MASTTSSYRLKRPRSSVTPLKLYDTTTATATSLRSPTFSYSEPASPPASARSLLASSSSTSNHRRDRSSIYASGRPRRETPPPNDASSKEMLEFATLCHTWYYEQDDQAGRTVTQIMQSVPDSLRAPYIKLQASIRSAYHASISSRRLAEFKALLSSTSPGGSLSPAARSNVRGRLAVTERHERFATFIKTWCNDSMPGPKPFFEGLWAVMRLMTLPENIGGAGSRRIEWEIDDAVFRETAGKDFMIDAITTLKGVLGFRDLPLIGSQSTSPSMIDVVDTEVVLQGGQTSSPQAVPLERFRETSDPFVDDGEEASTSQAPHLPPDGADPSKVQHSEAVSPAKSLSGAALFNGIMPSLNTMPYKMDALDEPQLRVWLAPDLSNPEYSSLYSLFPSAITNRNLPRFSSHLPFRRKENGLTEEFGEDEDVPSEIRCGTGRIWISDQDRTGPWKGGWWQRFVGWLRRIFC